MFNKRNKIITVKRKQASQSPLVKLAVLLACAKVAQKDGNSADAINILATANELNFASEEQAQAIDMISGLS